MNAFERQELRLKLLKRICESLNYDLNNSISHIKELFIHFPNISHDEISNNVLYLYEKGYVKCSLITMRGFSLPMNIRLDVSAIDLVEKIETNMSTEKYEDDFSKNALNNFSNISNSQIIVQSPGAQIDITNEVSLELLRFLEDISSKYSDNEVIKNICQNTIIAIEEKKSTVDYLKGIGSVLFNMGISITSNFLTPTVASIFGIPLI